MSEIYLYLRYFTLVFFSCFIVYRLSILPAPHSTFLGSLLRHLSVKSAQPARFTHTLYNDFSPYVSYLLHINLPLQY